MKIGVIGSGHMGTTLGRLWLAAGHEVCFCSTQPDALRDRLRAQQLPASVAPLDDTCVFGEVVLAALPYGAWPEVVPAIASTVAGRVVLDATNAYPQRDGAFAQAAIDAGEGSTVPIARLLPGARVVRAFNSVFWRTLESGANAATHRVGIPLAGDDRAALDLAATLVTDAGFDPVIVGPLSRAREFDPGTRVYNTGMTAAQIRAALHCEG